MPDIAPARHDRMVALVEQMLALHKQLPQASTPHEQTALERWIKAAERQIDALVYELYGLMEEEIGVVERGMSSLPVLAEGVVAVKQKRFAKKGLNLKDSREPTEFLQGLQWKPPSSLKLEWSVYCSAYQFI